MDGHEPNPFQMLRFLYDADVALADVPFCYWLAPVVNFVVGKVAGGWLGGYQARYKVFSQDAE